MAVLVTLYNYPNLISVLSIGDRPEYFLDSFRNNSRHMRPMHSRKE
jgi:hypothetical protein